MKLELIELGHTIRQKFSGDLLYMPIHLDDSRAARPAAQIARHPQVEDDISSTEPHSLTRSGASNLHVSGILHHQPIAKPRKG